MSAIDPRISSMKVPPGVDLATLERDIRRDFTGLTPAEIQAYYASWVESKTAWVFLLNSLCLLLGLGPNTSVPTILQVLEERIKNVEIDESASVNRLTRRLDEVEREKNALHEALLKTRVESEEEARRLKQENDMVQKALDASKAETEEAKAHRVKLQEQHNKEIASYKAKMRRMKSVQELRSHRPSTSSTISFGSRVESHSSISVDLANAEMQASMPLAPTPAQLQQQFPLARSTADRVTGVISARKQK